MNNLPIKFFSVEINNFRGVPGALNVPLNAPLTVIYAANGTGKSTICFALDWLLTGEIEGVDSKLHSCEWGDGETSVSAQCLIDGFPHVLLRKHRGFWLSRGDKAPVKMSDDKLLALLTPSTISGKSPAITKKSKRGWLRNSRWLYSNSLSLLIDNNRAADRQQIFADILGFGHLASTLRDLKDYRKALPSTKGLHENIIRLNAEIETTQRNLQERAPGRARAVENLQLLLSKSIDPRAVMAAMQTHGILIGTCVDPTVVGHHALRLGTQFITRQGMEVAQMPEVARLLAHVLKIAPYRRLRDGANVENGASLERIRHMLAIDRALAVGAASR